MIIRVIGTYLQGNTLESFRGDSGLLDNLPTNDTTRKGDKVDCGVLYSK
jgi:hypothetical protein